MKVMIFHLMPYGDLNLDLQKQYSSVWTVLPNTHYDPEKGHQLYNRYLDELELCAELDFDGVCVNEHHQTAYGMMPSPVVMASALMRRTKNCRIAILGNAFSLREHPQRGGRPPRYGVIKSALGESGTCQDLPRPGQSA